MKKFLSLFIMILFVSILSFSLMSFTDGPKKAKQEQAAASDDATEKKDCKHEEGKAEGKACCKETAKAEGSGCQKSETCKKHQEAEAK